MDRMLARLDILIAIGERHDLQILDVLDNLGANWAEIEDFYVDLVESGKTSILTGKPFTVEEAADQLWADLHRMAELHWLRSITREQAEIMEATVGRTICGRIIICQGVDFPAYTLTQEWDRANAERGMYDSEE